MGYSTTKPGRVRKVAVFVAVAALGALAPAAAWAAPTPNSGPAAGGTSVHGTAEGVTFTQIEGGDYHSLAIGSDGHAYAWGLGTSGQLGNNAWGSSPTPVQVATPAGAPTDFAFTAISAGGLHSLAIGSDGHAYAWGADGYGQLGNDDPNDYSPVPVPVSVPSGTTFTAVSADGRHSLAIGSDGHAYAWGRNTEGQLGTPTPGATSSVPVDASVLSVTGVAFGTEPAVDLDTSGDEWTATTPQSLVCGPVDVIVAYTQFGGTHAAPTPDGFTYQGTSPVITTQPAFDTLEPGEAFTATATATGDPEPTVQWQQSATDTDPWTDIPGATATTLATTPNATTHYRAVFTNCAGTVTTDTATATVEAPSPGPGTSGTSPGAGGTAPTTRAHGSTLPWTGADPTPLITTAAALLLLGATTVIAIRRRRTTTH